jgi:hypothetical protein
MIALVSKSTSVDEGENAAQIKKCCGSLAAGIDRWPAVLASIQR